MLRKLQIRLVTIEMKHQLELSTGGDRGKLVERKLMYRLMRLPIELSAGVAVVIMAFRNLFLNYAP
jgi:hypothetical protein